MTAPGRSRGKMAKSENGNFPHPFIGNDIFVNSVNT
jgi:hypothetical protein